MTLPKDNSQIFASKYETVLPSKAKLLKEQLSDEDGDETYQQSLTDDIDFTGYSEPIPKVRMTQ